jgi:hypothetical protein
MGESEISPCSKCANRSCEVTEFEVSETLPPPGNLIQAMPDGVFMTSCPHYLVYQSEATNEAFSAYSWREKSSLGVRYPGGVPLLLLYAIEMTANGISEGEREYMKQLENNSGK